jgi:transcriptional regulator with XRE-family HTH domain
LGKLTGIDFTRLSRIERGLLIATPEERRKLERVLGTPIDWDETEQLGVA